MLAAPKALEMVGGASMVTVSLAARALFPATVCSAPIGMLLVEPPTAELVTFTMTVQPPEGMAVPLPMVKLPAPVVAVTPAQLPAFPGVLMVIPAGKVSVKALLNVMAPTLALPMVTVRFVLPPKARFGTAKAFNTVGTIGVTVRVIGPAATPVRLIGPVAAGAVVLLLVLLVAVTTWVMVQVPPGTMVPLLKPTVVPRAVPPVSVALPNPLQTTPPAA